MPFEFRSTTLDLAKSDVTNLDSCKRWSPTGQRHTERLDRARQRHYKIREYSRTIGVWKIRIAIYLERQEVFNRPEHAAQVSRYVRVKCRFGGCDLETLGLSN
jgi:hypothetical protein